MPHKDPEKAREYWRKWRAKNRGKEYKYQQRYQRAHRKEQQARCRAWTKNNPDKKRAHVDRRRALKANAPQGNSTEAAAYSEILREGICELCGTKVPIHIDHIEPLSKGGEHGWENFAGLCQSCNSGKKDKSLLLHMLQQKP